MLYALKGEKYSRSCYAGRMDEVTNVLEDMGFKPLAGECDALQPLTFKTDHLLPRFLHIMPERREDLVESSLVIDHKIVLQVSRSARLWD